MTRAEPIELPITANTDRFARKLRAIATAAAALADEVEAIDAESAPQQITVNVSGSVLNPDDLLRSVQDGIRRAPHRGGS